MKIFIVLCLGIMAAASVARTLIVRKLAERITTKDVEESQFFNAEKTENEIDEQ